MVSLTSAVLGWVRLKSGQASKTVSFVLGIVSCVSITMALGVRGELRGACPLMDAGEVFLFIAWSLSLVYVLTGGTYRVSLLGLFSAPMVALFLGLVLVPGMLSENPVRAEHLDPWKESHAATSVLSFGALGLGALAAFMFLVLDTRLKAQKAGWVSMKMPPVNTLVQSVDRLLLLGVVVLSLGIAAGFVTTIESGLSHLITAGGVWIAYVALLVWYKWQGMPPKLFARITVGLFLLSCLLFFII